MQEENFPASSQTHDQKVLLIGGISGAGKTTVARQLGLRLGLPWLQVDDLRLALQWSRVSLPQRTEELYFFLLIVFLALTKNKRYAMIQIK